MYARGTVGIDRCDCKEGSRWGWRWDQEWSEKTDERRREKRTPTCSFMSQVPLIDFLLT